MYMYDTCVENPLRFVAMADKKGRLSAHCWVFSQIAWGVFVLGGGNRGLVADAHHLLGHLIAVHPEDR